MNNLKGKKALVTGGGSGIGAAIVNELVDQGADVAIHYYTSKKKAEQLSQEAQKQGVSAFAVRGDLTCESDVVSMMETIGKRFGSLDVLVNNTGDIVDRQTLEGMELDFYRKVMAVNMESMMLVTREALPLLKNNPDGSSIVNLSSLAGRKGGGDGAVVYAAAKGAILTWTRSLSTELAPYGIRINAVAPGLILGSRFHELHTPDESQKKIISGIPLKRAGQCQDVARVVAFLASETNGFVTGATIDINGGVYVA
jgi:3-oxoacyl-[acyl-carrier protein] reductase